MNTKEGIWNILKQKVRKNYTYRTVKKLRTAFKVEWEKISQDSIRKRIQEIPERYAWMLNNNGMLYRTFIW